jgi:Global regulator protein family
MLVFTRRRDEAIVIGDGVEVRVLRTGYDAVRAANQTAAQAVLPPLADLAGRLRLQPPLERVE